MQSVEFVPFSEVYKEAFRNLNEFWIKKYFQLEEDDIQTLQNPEKILQGGGYIFVALLGKEPVGVCALRKKSEDTFEFSKMAVANEAQGMGIGRKLAELAIAKAREVHARRIYLEGNTILEASIHLYRQLGFKEIQGQQSDYKRVNIIMEMYL